MDAVRAKELREKIEGARREEKDSLAFLRRDRHKQVETARNAGAGADTIEALNREYDRYEAGVTTEANQRIEKWQRELDALVDGST